MKTKGPSKNTKNRLKNMPNEKCMKYLQFYLESNSHQALIYVTLDESFEQFTVKELLFFQGKLCEVLKVSPTSLQLCHIKPGSLKLIFQVPSFAEPPAFPLSQDKQEALRKLRITYLSYSSVYHAFSEPAGDAFNGIDFTAPCFQEKKNIKILLYGKTGVGKSSLINSLVGSNVRKVSVPGMQDGSLEPVGTLNVSQTVINYNGISITLFDSPGLQDCTEDEEKHLSKIYDECKDVDLFLYCMDFTQARFTTADTRCIELLTEKFGEDIWKRCVSVMSKANAVRVNLTVGGNEKEYHKRRYETFLKSFQDKLVEKGVSNISILGVATGSYDENNERERYVWFVSNRPPPTHRQVDFLSELWVTCFETVFRCSRSSFVTPDYKLKDIETEEERLTREAEEARLRNERIRQEQEALMRQRQQEQEQQQAAEERRRMETRATHTSQDGWTLQ